MICKVLPEKCRDMGAVQSLMNSVDIDRNQVLDFAEFLYMMRKLLDEDWQVAKRRSTTRT